MYHTSMSRRAIEQLVQLGEEYIGELAASEPNLYEQWQISAHTKGRPYNDGTRLVTASSLLNVGAEMPSQSWLDEPLFEWNGSTDEPQFRANYNPTINTNECSALGTVGVACAILGETLPAESALKDTLLKRVGATFFTGASPRMLMDGIAPDVGFICKDDSEPDIHSVSAQIFFGSIAMRSIVAFDLHDIAHHAAQIKQWPDFYTRLGDFAYSAFTSTDDEETRLKKSLGVLLSDATFEECVLEDSGNLFSFGCLNWLSPRGTPASRESMFPIGSTEKFQLLHRWHMLFAVKDLYRTQADVSKRLGIELDWLEVLGYEADPEFIRISEQQVNAPLSDLDLSSAYDFTVHAPKTSDELFANAQKLLDRHQAG